MVETAVAQPAAVVVEAGHLLSGLLVPIRVRVTAALELHRLFRVVQPLTRAAAVVVAGLILARLPLAQAALAGALTAAITMLAQTQLLIPEAVAAVAVTPELVLQAVPAALASSSSSTPYPYSLS